MEIGDKYQYCRHGVTEETATIVAHDPIKQEVFIHWSDGSEGWWTYTSMMKYFKRIEDKPITARRGYDGLAVGQTWFHKSCRSYWTIVELTDTDVISTNPKWDGPDRYPRNRFLKDWERREPTDTTPPATPEPAQSTDCNCTLAQLMDGHWSADCAHHATAPESYIGRTGLGIPRPDASCGDTNLFTRAEINAACLTEVEQNIRNSWWYNQDRSIRYFRNTTDKPIRFETPIYPHDKVELEVRTDVDENGDRQWRLIKTT